MKIKLFLLAIAATCISSAAFSQSSFGVSPGIGLNTAYYGYRVNDKLMPFVGFQFLNIKVEGVEKGEEFDFNQGQLVSYSRSNEFSGSLYIPNLGLKYFVKEENSIKAYLTLSVSKPFITASITDDGENDEDFEEDVKNLSLLGGEFGFGVEYFFDENFSIGGEFGIRYFHLKYEETRDEQIFVPNSGNGGGTIVDTEIQNDFNFNISPTYSKIALNYYFGGKSE